MSSTNKRAIEEEWAVNKGEKKNKSIVIDFL